MAEASKQPPKKAADKVFDVSKPGKSTPSATSKPVITHHPMLQDPMVNESATEEQPATAPILKPVKKIVITPIHPDVTPEEDAVAQPDAAPEEDAVAQPDAAPEASDDNSTQVEVKTSKTEPADAVEADAKPADTTTGAEPANDDTNPAKETVNKEAAAEPVTAKPEASAAASTNSIDIQPATKKTDTAETSNAESSLDSEAQVDEEAAKAAAEHAAAVQKLVDSEQYALPINSLEKRRSKQFAFFGILLIILLAVGWGDIALDAGLISDTSNLPHTHFFAKQTTSSVTPTVHPVAAVATKSYTVPVSNLSFNYPANWKFSSQGSSAQLDNVSISPNGTADVATGAITVTFSSQDTSNGSSCTVAYVHYQKLAHQLGGNTYVRDLIYKDASGTINIVSSLTNDTADTVGETLPTIDQDFLDTAGTTNRSQFVVSVVRSSAGSLGFSSTQDARAFMQTANYQKARAILLSTTEAKN